MKKINEKYVLSATDIKRVEAHCRALARKAQYSGEIRAELDTDTGEVHYCECVGQGEYTPGLQHIYTARTSYGI